MRRRQQIALGSKSTTSMVYPTIACCLLIKQMSKHTVIIATLQERYHTKQKRK